MSRAIDKLDKAAVAVFIKREGQEAYDSGQGAETLERIEQPAIDYDDVFLAEHPEIDGHNIIVYHDPIAGEDLAVVDTSTDKVVEIFDKDVSRLYKAKIARRAGSRRRKRGSTSTAMGGLR
jgi:hypothetical protein